MDINAYAEKEDCTQEEAFQKVFMDKAMEVVLDTLGGALSTGTSVAIGQGIKKQNNILEPKPPKSPRTPQRTPTSLWRPPTLRMQPSTPSL